MTIGNQQVQITKYIRCSSFLSSLSFACHVGAARSGLFVIDQLCWLELSSVCYALLTIRNLTGDRRVSTLTHARNHNQTECFERKTSSNNTKTICSRICSRFFRGRKSLGICGRSFALRGASCAFSVAHNCGRRRDRSASINRSSQ
jgi:hypothetical protein